MLKKLVIPAAALAAFLATATSAFACGGLVAPNGAIRLSRATTMVAWHDGVERYLTSFSYQGTDVQDFGWIVPLPAAPDKVEEGGGWTLQRLQRATHPQPQLAFAAGGAARAANAEVLMQVKVRALDITVLKGSGQAIVDWCRQNDFLLNAETKAHLLVYAKASPFFMAAKYNIARAQATRQVQGDGAPVLITMRVPHMWIPLEVLANGTDQVGADLYLLTDNPVYTSDLGALVGELPQGTFVPGAPGLTVRYQEPIDAQLFRDLSTDKNMGWVRPNRILTYLTLDAPAFTVRYDMGVSDSNVIRVASYGTRPMDVASGTHSITDPSIITPDPQDDSLLLAPGVRSAVIAMGLMSLLLLVALFVVRHRRRSAAN
jgi:hypothetical protein